MTGIVLPSSATCRVYRQPEMLASWGLPGARAQPVPPHQGSRRQPGESATTSSGDLFATWRNCSAHSARISRTCACPGEVLDVDEAGLLLLAIGEPHHHLAAAGVADPPLDGDAGGAERVHALAREQPERPGGIGQRLDQGLVRDQLDDGQLEHQRARGRIGGGPVEHREAPGLVGAELVDHQLAELGRELHGVGVGLAAAAEALPPGLGQQYSVLTSGTRMWWQAVKSKAGSRQTRWNGSFGLCAIPSGSAKPAGGAGGALQAATSSSTPSHRADLS